jgi:hypothetical protein
VFDASNILAGIARGATVLDFTGEKIGTVKDVEESRGYIQIEKGWLFHKDFYIPASAINRVDDVGSVVLNLNKRDLDDSYDSPPIPDKTLTDADLADEATAGTDVTNPAGVMGGSGPVDEYSDSSAATLGSDAASRWPVDEESP